MINYNFLVLSPSEFEEISRDLLQKKLNCYIESFATGRDGGVDLRCTTDGDKTMIIQAKRHKDWSNLLSSLKNEWAKVLKHNPEKYVLTSSVALTPSNKQAIIDLFAPYIKSTEDIFGVDDLNNLLGIYPEIERKFYKLWLSSSNVLDQVLHSRIYNISIFELEEINEQIKYYVQNDSFEKALEILNKNQYVIISGIPGIGKTTLARVLIFYLLGRGYDELVFLSHSVDDAFEQFKDGKNQVFFFDDFLGRNFFGERKNPNEDSKISKLIKKIRSTPGKLLIFTTREYVLNQAKYSYDSFKINNIEVAKCILDLSTYTKMIRAQIIYNHLFFADVPADYLESLVASRKYITVIQHPNYNPRILETIINYRIWERVDLNSFPQRILEYFDNPESVWLDAFENSLDRFSKYSLLVLLSLGTPVLIEDWERAIRSFVSYNSQMGLVYDEIEFHKVLRVLENSFIRSQKDSSEKVAIEYQNPSVQDFLVNYLQGKPEIIRNIFDSAIFINQLSTVFTSDTQVNDTNKRKVVISQSLVLVGFNRLRQLYSNSLISSKLVRRVYNDRRFYWHVDEDVIYSFLDRMRLEYQGADPGMIDIIYDFLNNKGVVVTGDYSERRAYISLLKNLDRKKLHRSETEIILDFMFNLHWLENIIQLDELRTIFPNTFGDVLQRNFFEDSVHEVASGEMESLGESDIVSFREQLDKVEQLFNISMSREYERLVEIEDETSREIAAEDIPVISDFKMPKIRSYLSEDELIEEMFKSLVQS